MQKMCLFPRMYILPLAKAGVAYTLSPNSGVLMSSGSRPGLKI